MTLEPTLAEWVDACLRRPDALPDGVEPVQTRLVRWVGRGVVPGLGEVYLKVMGFPRARDRVRYVHRALPAIHEARMLARLAEVGIRSPEVVVATGRRRCGIPAASVLVTRALPASHAVELADAARITAELLRAGVFHPDLNRGNFHGLPDRQTAVLDLQSARWYRRGVPAPLRRRMVAKLIVEFDASDRIEAVARDCGLATNPEISGIESDTRILVAADLRRRVRRCTTTSTQFAVRRRWNGTTYWRRSLKDERGAWIEHSRAVELWIGERFLELVDGRKPVLGAMFRKSWWLPGKDSLYISGGDGITLSADHEVCLLQGFGRLQSLDDARGERLRDSSCSGFAKSTTRELHDPSSDPD